jgi:hypothetical protein
MLIGPRLAKVAMKRKLPHAIKWIYPLKVWYGISYLIG